MVDIHREPADLLILSHPNFIDSLRPLVEAREAQGYRVRVVDVEDVYAHYSGGVLDAEALRSFIEFAVRELETRYVLLVGGDTYDYKDYTGVGSLSFLPSLYARTGSLVYFAPADPLYGDLDRDRVPDIPVGRFPVRTVAELEAVIAKTLAYETSDYRRQAVIATDADDPSEAISYREAGDLLATQLGPKWQVERADIDELGVTEARDRLVEAIEAGAALTQYFGHSGPSVWSFQNLFTAGQAAALENEGRPTAVVQWGCWNTYYVAPENNTMAHRLLLSGERGAAIALGASTLTTTESDLALGLRFGPRLADPGNTVGDALVQAKRALADESPGAFIDVIVGWTLLGDPTVVVDP